MATLTRIIRFNVLKSSFNLYRCFSSQEASTKLPLVRLTNSLHNPWIWQQQDSIKPPTIIKNISLPSGMILNLNYEDPIKVNKVIEAPINTTVDNTKQAARLIVIRRKKMKKHKLRKLRKKMKFAWAKIRQKRELRKEKAFQAQLIKQYKEVEAFSAEKYVEENIAKLQEVNLLKQWKSKLLPEQQIIENMGLSTKK